MINPQQHLVEQQRVRVDWRAYWKEFSRAHGDFPVVYRNRFLFRDGWTYAMDYPGPEWSPVNDPVILAQVIRAYWVLRKRQVRRAWWDQYCELRDLKSLQSTRSLPLMHSSTFFVQDDEGITKAQRCEGPVDFAAMEMEVNRLKAELDECERNLHGLVQSPELDTGTPQKAGSRGREDIP